MRIPDGIVYLTQPLFGRQILRGKVTLLTTWLDYTFPEKLSSAELGLGEDELPAHQVRVLIPLDNIRAVVAECDEELDTQ